MPKIYEKSYKLKIFCGYKLMGKQIYISKKELGHFRYANKLRPNSFGKKYVNEEKIFYKFMLKIKY